MATKKKTKAKATKKALRSTKKPSAAARRRGTAATKSTARKKAPARKASERTAKPAPKPARKKAKRPPVRRRDGAGHLDPQYAADLRAKSWRPPEDPESFIERPRSRDDLVEELGEEVVAEATSAEHEGEDILDQEVPEERGGPFVETTGAEEFAHGIDASNPRGAKREPFPRT
jgi:hypothetical protein